MVLVKYRKILTGLLLDILIHCRPKISVLFKNPKILTSKIGHGFLGVKNMILRKYRKILTGVLLDILIQCRPKISVLFKNPKILTSKIGYGFFGVKKKKKKKKKKKHRSYEITQDSDSC